jgi:hypothetical protein
MEVIAIYSRHNYIRCNQQPEAMPFSMVDGREQRGKKGLRKDRRFGPHALLGPQETKVRIS